MNIGNVFFALCALVALFGAVSTVAAKNPIRGAVGLLACIIAIAGMFLQLSAEFLAAIQLIVYAGAVVVLFVFVIMLLGPDARSSGVSELKSLRAHWWRVLGGALLALLSLAVGGFAAMAGTEPVPFAKAAPNHGHLEAVGQLLFTKGLVPFELATALLIVAVIGSIAVARGKFGVAEGKKVQTPLKLFGGPVVPRDAGRPLPKEGLS